MVKNYKEVLDILKNNDSFLIASHAHPDGDGIGSTLALGCTLLNMGKRVVMYNQDGIPRNLKFLSGSDLLVTKVDSNLVFDVSILVDCSQPERAGADFPEKDKRGQLICVDHHSGVKCESGCELIDETASSTGEVVYNLINDLETKVDDKVATLILTTLIVDTGNFKYSNTKSSTLELASELVSKGASTWEVNKNLTESNSPKRIELLKSVLGTMSYHHDGKLALIILTNQMLKLADADLEMAEDFINFPRSIAGVEVAVMIREQTKDRFKVSFRSKDIVDVAELSFQYKGGGHRHAAGCTLDGKLGEIKSLIIKDVGKTLRRVER